MIRTMDRKKEARSAKGEEFSNRNEMASYLSLGNDESEESCRKFPEFGFLSRQKWKNREMKSSVCYVFSSLLHVTWGLRTERKIAAAIMIEQTITSTTSTVRSVTICSRDLGVSGTLM